jgi:hypothetical protein
VTSVWTAIASGIQRFAPVWPFGQGYVNFAHSGGAHRIQEIAVKPILACLAISLASPAYAASLKDLFPQGEQRCMAFIATDAKKGETESFELFRLLGPDDVFEDIKGTLAEEAKRSASYDGTTLDVQVRFKGDRKAYWQGVGCSEANGKVQCSVDCDGGSFTGKIDKDAFKLRLDSSGFVLQGGCGEEGETTRFMTNKEAPKGLTLSPRDISHCEAARAANVKTRLRDSVSLRARILQNNWRCLQRTYDEAHLAENPKQTVSQISISIIDEPKRVIDNDDASTLMKVAITAKLRDGKIATAQHECFSQVDSFVCGSSFRLYRRDGETALLKMGVYDAAPGDEQPEWKISDMKLGKDDKLFKLDATSGACAP